MNRRDLVTVLISVAISTAVMIIFYLFFLHRSAPDRITLGETTTRQRANAIVVAASKVGPAVVSITVTQTRIVTVSPFPDDFFNDFFRDFFPERRYQEQVKSLGSGVVISADGYIVTNEHVTMNATQIKVTLPSGRRLDGRIIAADRTNDLALLKIDGNDLPFAELGNSDDLMIGEWVIALGNPFAFLLEDAQPTVTVGVISAINRSIKSTYEDRVYRQMIQTDAAINPGNSGGPLINVLGQVIGINTFIFTSGGGSEGIGFARPVSIVRKFVAETRQYGKVRIPWIGIWPDDLSQPPARDQGGAVITRIDDGSPAAKAGIRPGDVVSALDGMPVTGAASWDRTLAGHFVGDTLTLLRRREQGTESIILVVAEFNEPTGLQTKQGLNIADIQPYYIKKFSLGYREGLVVTDILTGSDAARAGFQPGDVILRVGNLRIRNRVDLTNAMEQTGMVPWIVGRAGVLMQITMER